MVLQGAELLLYPTAIGSEPYDLTLDTHEQWQRAMQGHAVSNAVPIVAAVGPLSVATTVSGSSSVSSSAVATSNVAEVAAGASVTSPESRPVRSAASVPAERATDQPTFAGSAVAPVLVTVKRSGSPSYADAGATSSTGGASPSMIVFVAEAVVIVSSPVVIVATTVSSPRRWMTRGSVRPSLSADRRTRARRG